MKATEILFEILRFRLLRRRGIIRIHLSSAGDLRSKRRWHLPAQPLPATQCSRKVRMRRDSTSVLSDSQQTPVQHISSSLQLREAPETPAACSRSPLGQQRPALRQKWFWGSADGPEQLQPRAAAFSSSPLSPGSSVAEPLHSSQPAAFGVRPHLPAATGRPARNRLFSSKVLPTISGCPLFSFLENTLGT